MRNIFQKIRTSLVVSLLFAYGVHAAGPWYVSTTGEDTPERDGLSWEQAWLTLSNAVARATTGTILVSNGVYKLSEQIVVSKALTIEGANGRDNTIIDGDGVTRCFRLEANNIVLRGLTITNGSAQISEGLYSYHGGGVRVVGNSAVTLDSCIIAGNEAVMHETAAGGGVFVGYDPKTISGVLGTTITNCIIRGNEAKLRGGGIDAWNAGSKAYPDLAVIDSQIEDNALTGVSDNRGGGGISFQGRGLTVRDCTVAGNTILEDGGSAHAGGIKLSCYLGYDTLIENCTVVSNTLISTSSLYGGGLSINGSNVVVRNSLFADNVLESRSTGYTFGGGVWLNNYRSGDNRIESCTIAGNISRNQSGVREGSGLMAAGERDDIIINCLIYGNADAQDLSFNGPDLRSDHIHYTCTTRTLRGVGNILGDPLFVDPENGNYRLRSGSPCLNSGMALDWMADATDLDGKPRIDVLNRKPDMGCYERVFAGSLLMLR